MNKNKQTLNAMQSYYAALLAHQFVNQSRMVAVSSIGTPASQLELGVLHSVNEDLSRELAACEKEIIKYQDLINQEEAI